MVVSIYVLRFLEIYFPSCMIEKNMTPDLQYTYMYLHCVFGIIPRIKKDLHLENDW